MTVVQRPIDPRGKMTEDDIIDRIVARVMERLKEERYQKALRVRNAHLELLRATEDLDDLPRSVPSKVERGEVPPKTEHHNR